MNFNNISIEAKHQLLDSVRSDTMYAIDYQLHGARKTLYSRIISSNKPAVADVPEMEELYFYFSAVALIKQLHGEGLSPDIFISEVSQLGSAFTIGSYLQLVGRGTKKIFGLLRESGPFSKETGWYTMERIFGSSGREIGGRVLCSNNGVALKTYEADAILLAQKLAIQLGLEIGPVSGVNLLRAIELQNWTDDEESMITVFQDDISALQKIQPQYHDAEKRLNAYNIAFLDYRELRKVPEAFFKQLLGLV